MHARCRACILVKVMASSLIPLVCPKRMIKKKKKLEIQEVWVRRCCSYHGCVAFTVADKMFMIRMVNLLGDYGTHSVMITVLLW